MAIIGWIGLGMAAGILAGGFRRGDGRRTGLPARCAVGTVGALLAGLAATAAGIGPIDDFFHAGTWLIALGGAALALCAHRVATTTQGRREASDQAIRLWAAREGVQREPLDRNW